jgi:CyaY protein
MVILDSRDDPMDRQDYDRLADACLERAVKALEPFDPDEVDYSTSDGVVTIEFQGGVRYVLNRQSAMHQMWFAAGARAWHFDWDAAKKAWIDDKEGRELFGRISEVVSAKIGRAVAL